jgi:siderophore synthetase component
VIAQDGWRQANSLVLHKMLGELSYEGLLRPRPEPGDGGWVVALPGGVDYRFSARRGAFESWVVTPDSAVRRHGDEPAEPAADARRFLVEAREVLGLTGLRLADVLTELTATLTNEAIRLGDPIKVGELVTMDYDLADGHLTGHPRLVLNKGRLGFSGSDRARYAPESGGAFAVRWIAVHRELAAFRSVAGLSEQRLREDELGPAQVEEFEQRLREHGDPADYVWLPTHPWQHKEILGTHYAGEYATGAVVDLGESADRYVPHQTVRTLANISHPSRRDVKTALSVRNTLVYRGLAAGATIAGPAVTDWLTAVGCQDSLLHNEYHFDLLGEVASVSVRHPVFGALKELPYRYHETLGVLWRVPIRTRLGDGERALSFAALPYRDSTGASVIGTLIRAAEVEPVVWVRRLLELTLVPLLHWLLRYGVAFCPHGQNLILVLDRAGLPARVSIKDFAQGVDLLDEDLPDYASLAPEAAAEMLRWPAHLLAQSLFSSVFSGQFRFLAEILLDDCGLARTAFWDEVRDVVRGYRADHPESARRFDDCRLFDEAVEKVCLNTEHLAGQGFDKVDRDEDFDVRTGTVRNPLHGADPGGAW